MGERPSYLAADTLKSLCRLTFPLRNSQDLEQEYERQSWWNSERVSVNTRQLLLGKCETFTLEKFVIDDLIS